ncbi:MAG: hypothetical protein HQ462_05555, partial [Deltaproteobacteria bacterium]|nr:hypothetical protein [Deltaproteobacteria bacterium]
LVRGELPVRNADIHILNPALLEYFYALMTTDNLVVFIDNNNGQIDGHVTEVMDLRPLTDKWRAFRWAVQEIDGHDFNQIIGALEKARLETEKPTLIVAKTVKGKGVSFMENAIGWHGVTPNKEQLQQALIEINGGLKS